MKPKYTLSLILIMLLSCYVVAQELTPTPTHAVINVLVTNMSDVPSEGDFITLESVDTSPKEVLTGITKNDGKFQLLLRKGVTYDVKFKSWEFDTDYSQVPVPDVEGNITFNYIIKYELPKLYTLEHVFFDTGKATLRQESNKALNNLLEIMKYKKKLKIEVAGHTDSDGDDTSNQILSENRAKAVRNYLINRGIEAHRIVAKGYGEARPVANNETADGKQMNRRTEVKILSE